MHIGLFFDGNNTKNQNTVLFKNQFNSVGMQKAKLKYLIKNGWECSLR